MIGWQLVALTAIGAVVFLALKFQIGRQHRTELLQQTNRIQDEVAASKAKLDAYSPLLARLPDWEALEKDVKKLRLLMEQNELSKLGARR